MTLLSVYPIGITVIHERTVPRSIAIHRPSCDANVSAEVVHVPGTLAFDPVEPMREERITPRDRRLRSNVEYARDPSILRRNNQRVVPITVNAMLLINSRVDALNSEMTVGWCGGAKKKPRGAEVYNLHNIPRRRETPRGATVEPVTPRRAAATGEPLHRVESHYRTKRCATRMLSAASPSSRRTPRESQLTRTTRHRPATTITPRFRNESLPTHTLVAEYAIILIP